MSLAVVIVIALTVIVCVGMAVNSLEAVGKARAAAHPPVLIGPADAQDLYTLDDLTRALAAAIRRTDPDISDELAASMARIVVEDLNADTLPPLES